MMNNEKNEDKLSINNVINNATDLEKENKTKINPKKAIYTT